MKITINGELVSIYKLKYECNNRIALVTDKNNEPWAVLSVNLPKEKMEENETAIDVNNLGRGIIWQLVKQSIIESPHPDKWVKSGFIEYPICKVLI